MTKRGSMFEFVVLISVFMAFFVYVVIMDTALGYGTGKIVLKTAAARDIALILDTLYAYPYDVEIEYDVDLSDFIVEISEKTVEISEKTSEKDTDITAAQYPFVPVVDDLELTLLNPKKIIFTKKNGILGVTGILLETQQNENI